MLLVFRWLLRIASVLVVLSVIAVTVVYYLASRSLPVYDKALYVSGLTAPTRILPDHSNVPHIFSEEVAAVFFGL